MTSVVDIKKKKDCVLENQIIIRTLNYILFTQTQRQMKNVKRSAINQQSALHMNLVKPYKIRFIATHGKKTGDQITMVTTESGWSKSIKKSIA